MADFVTKSVTKSAVREFTAQIDTLVNYNALIQGILTGKPLELYLVPVCRGDYPCRKGKQGIRQRKK